MRKLIKIILLACMSILMTTTPVFAATGDSIQPLWDNTDSVKANIAFSGTTGVYSAQVFGDSDVTDIIAFAKLYYKNANGGWVEIPMPWGFISTTKDIYITESFEAVSGVEYKVELEANVYVDYDCETIYVTTTNTCP